MNKELPALLLVTLVTGALLFDESLGIFDALVLISITGFFGYKIFQKRIKSSVVPEIEESKVAGINSIQAILYLILGLALLILSAQVLVGAASSIAEQLGVSTAIIGLTIVALGTSLPELAASITCVLKGHHDLAIGNIVGSNLLNLLAVLPFPGLLSAGPFDPSLLYRDYFGVLILTLLLAFFCHRAIKKNKMIGRINGMIFLSIYGGWFTLMLIQVQS